MVFSPLTQLSNPPAPVISVDSTTERSPSLLSHVKRLTEDDPAHQAKRKKENSEPAGDRNQKHLSERSCLSSCRQQDDQVRSTGFFKGSLLQKLLLNLNHGVFLENYRLHQTFSCFAKLPPQAPLLLLLSFSGLFSHVTLMNFHVEALLLFNIQVY